jgi:membrane protease YdiL (CAAX protease family)
MSVPAGRKPAILAYLLLVFALTIPFWILEMVRPVELLPGLPLSALGALTPAAAALILAGGERWKLLGRCFDFREIKSRGWFAVSLLVNPLIALIAYAILRISQPIPLPTPLTPGVIGMFLFFLLGGLTEELGWTGYATQPLLERRGMIVTALLLGTVWAVWHFPALFQAGHSAEWIAWWSLGTLTLRLIMVWFYVRAGGSVFAAALFHALINLCWQLFPVDGSYYDPRVFGLVTLGVAIILYTAAKLGPHNRARKDTMP